MDPERVQTLASKISRKTRMDVVFFAFCESNMSSLMGKIKKLKKKTLLGHFWIAQSMDFIFPILNGYRPKSKGFRTITRQPQTQISCFLVLIALF